MAWQSRDLSGLEKASVLISILGVETSAKVFEQLTPDERDLLGAQISKLSHIDSAMRDQVVYEVSQRIRVSRPEADGRQDSASADAGPFRWLESVDPDDVASILAGERAQNVALVLAHLSPRGAADLLVRMTDTMKNEVSLRLANMKPVSKETVDAVDSSIRLRISRGKQAEPIVGGGESILKLLSGATSRVRESVHGGSRGTTPDADVRVTPMSSPEDLLRLSDDEVQAIIGRVALDDLCVALTVASDDLKSTVLNNMTPEAARIVRQRLEAAGSTRLSEIEEAQTRIVGVLALRVAGSANPSGAGGAS